MLGINIKTEPGFSPSIDAELVGRTANDYIHVDPTGTHMRLNAHGVIKDKISGGFAYVNYQGVVDLTPELGAILGGEPGAKSTEFGGSCKYSWSIGRCSQFLSSYLRSSCSAFLTIGD